MNSVLMGNAMSVRGGVLGHFGDAWCAAMRSALVERVVETGSLVIRKLGGPRAREIGSHRFLSAPSVTCGEMVEMLADRTARASVQDVGLSRRRTRRKSISPAARHVAAALGRRVMGYRRDFSCIP